MQLDDVLDLFGLEAAASLEDEGDVACSLEDLFESLGHRAHVEETVVATTVVVSFRGGKTFAFVVKERS